MRCLQRMLERSEELRLFDLGPVEDLLERSGRHRGRGELRKAIAGFELDLYWEEEHLAVELDSYAILSDRRRTSSSTRP